MLLRSAGQAVACGQISDGQCSIPPLDEGISYLHVSAGGHHTVLLRSDGQAVAGKIPMGNAAYHPWTKAFHTSRFLQEWITECFSEVMVKLLLAGKISHHGQCSIPPLDEGISYIQVSAGFLHTVLLRSDGQAVACGKNPDLECDIPSLPCWSYRYICDFTTFGKNRVVQVEFLLEGDIGILLTCVGLDGRKVLQLTAQKSDRTGHGDAYSPASKMTTMA